MHFNKKYFLAAVLLFIIEVLIALFVNDRFIRPYVGDYLVVMLLYCAVKAIFRVPVVATAIAVLLFSYAIETAQYFNLVARLHLQNNKWANVIIGNSFAVEDLVAYTLGIITIIGVEKIKQKRPNFNHH